MIFLARPAIIAGQVHTEWYRSGYNGPDSKSGVPATVPWVRIPPTPPNNIHPHLGMDVVFLLWVRFESRRLGDMPVACRNRRGRIPPTPPVGCVIRGWMLFFCCGWDSKAGALATCRRHVATGVGGMRSLCPGGAKPAHAACSREPRKPGIRCHFDGQKACIHASFRRFRNYSHSLPSSLF